MRIVLRFLRWAGVGGRRFWSGGWRFVWGGSRCWRGFDVRIWRVLWFWFWCWFPVVLFWCWVEWWLRDGFLPLIVFLFVVYWFNRFWFWVVFNTHRFWSEWRRTVGWVRWSLLLSFWVVRFRFSFWIFLLLVRIFSSRSYVPSLTVLTFLFKEG